jgi:hypothetical protein
VKEFSVFFVRIVQHAGMCISKTKLISAKEKSKPKQQKKTNKTKYVHNIQGVVIKQNIFS